LPIGVGGDPNPAPVEPYFERLTFEDDWEVTPEDLGVFAENEEEMDINAAGTDDEEVEMDIAETDSNVSEEESDNAAKTYSFTFGPYHSYAFSAVLLFHLGYIQWLGTMPDELDRHEGLRAAFQYHCPGLIQAGEYHRSRQQ
jgi:hypothetical protein